MREDYINVPKGMFRDVVLLVMTRGGIILFDMVTGVFIARQFGPPGKGILATVMAIAGIAVQFGTVGLPIACIYFLARDQHLLKRIVANTVWFSFIAGFGIAGLIFLVCQKMPYLIPGIDAGLLGVFLAALPAIFFMHMAGMIFLGMLKVHWYNVIQLVSSFLFFAFVIILSRFGGERSPVYAFIIAQSVIAALCMLFFLRILLGRLTFDMPLFLNMLRYSLKAYASALGIILLLRGGLLVVNMWGGVIAAGVFSVSLAFGELLLFLPQQTALAFFPRVSAKDDAGISAQTVSRHVALVMLILCIILVVVARWLVVQLFGKAFSDALEPLYWLLPGIWCMSIAKIILSYLMAKGNSPVVYIAPCSAACAHLLISFFLVRVNGYVGVAASFSFSSLLLLILVCNSFYRVSGVRITDTFILWPSEIARYLKNLCRVRLWRA